MKCIILSAGIGSRLKPYTDKVPKPLMPIINKPVIQYNIDLAKQLNIKDFLINLYHHPKPIIDYMKNSGVNFTAKIEKSLTGPAGALNNFKTEILGESAILIMSADCIHEFDISDMLQFHEKSGADITLRLKEVDDPWNYGVIKTDKTGKIISFKEKPAKTETNSSLVSCGLYIITPKILDYIPKDKEFDYVDVIKDLVKDGGKAFGYKTFKNDYWLDIGTPEKLLQGNIYHLKKQGNSFLEGENTEISGDAVISGYVSIGKKCIIKSGVKLHNVVLLDNTIVEKNVSKRNCILEGRVTK